MGRFITSGLSLPREQFFLAMPVTKELEQVNNYQKDGVAWLSFYLPFPHTQ